MHQEFSHHRVVIFFAPKTQEEIFGFAAGSHGSFSRQIPKSKVGKQLCIPIKLAKYINMIESNTQTGCPF